MKRPHRWIHQKNGGYYKRTKTLFCYWSNWSCLYLVVQIYSIFPSKLALLSSVALQVQPLPNIWNRSAQLIISLYSCCSYPAPISAVQVIAKLVAPTRQQHVCELSRHTLPTHLVSPSTDVLQTRPLRSKLYKVSVVFHRYSDSI